MGEVNGTAVDDGNVTVRNVGADVVVVGSVEMGAVSVRSDAVFMLPCAFDVRDVLSVVALNVVPSNAIAHGTLV